jgi:hypothetical protein
MKYLITESQANETIRQLLEKYGVRKFSEKTTLTPEKIISMSGLIGTQEDMLYLVKIIMDKDLTELRYCSYKIIPTQHSFKLYVFIPEPAPENKGKYMFETGMTSMYNDIISQLLFRYGTGIFKGHSVHVSNTGKC